MTNGGRIRWLLVAECNQHLKRLFGVRFVNHSTHTSTSRRVVGNKVNLDDDDPTENNKALAGPPAVTESALQAQIELQYFKLLQRSSALRDFTPTREVKSLLDKAQNSENNNGKIRKTE
ncbi:hypothetical protein T08_4152 [Trichinella sp. T8]|nr:hypothetical protein T08_4152 [Trichinella sp. T8]